MSNEVVTTGGAVPALVEARLRQTVDNFYKSIERDRNGREVMDALPAPALRSELTDRRRTLHGVLRPISMAVAEQKRAAQAVAALLGGYLNIRTDNPAGIAAGYTAHLAEQPLFSILQACDDFKHHRVVDRTDEEGKPVYFTMDHAPSAFRLLDQVKKCAEDARAERYKIGRVLAITHVKERPTLSAEEQARVAEGLSKLAAGMLRRANREEEAARQKIRAEADEARDRAQRIIQDAARRRKESEGVQEQV